MKKLVVLLVLFQSITYGFNLKHNSKLVNPFLVEKVNYGKVNPLCVSIYKNDIELVKKMIKYGVDVNEFSEGKTPLMYACRYNRLELIKVLVTNGAKLNLKYVNGKTALDYARLSNAKDAENLLLRYLG